ncbi:MAG TPA: hypothetical protein VLX68_16095 [Chitinivibrionales bacterium]|nr:hypothetical protein [Chitinivibrionales bacterium]
MKSVRLFGMYAIMAGIIIIRSSSGQCTKDTDCKGDRVCVDGECVEPQKSKTEGSSASEPEKTGKTGNPGWAFGAAITGYACAPVILGLGIASAATTGSDASLPLGVSAFSVGVATFPVTAVGGASARMNSGARGVLGLRIPGYIAYGLALVNGGVLIAFSIANTNVTIPAAPIVTCAALGTAGCVLMSTDALISARQAARGGSSDADHQGTLRLSLVPARKGAGMRVEYLF